MPHAHDLTDQTLILQAHQFRRQALQGSSKARSLAHAHEAELRKRLKNTVADAEASSSELLSMPSNSYRTARNDESSATNPESSLELVIATSDMSSSRTANAVSGLLRNVRELLDMDIAFVSEFAGGRRIFRHVDAAADQLAKLDVGQSDPLEETYCQRVVDSRLPLAIPDTDSLSEARDLSVTETLNIRAYLSAPITFSNGQVYGTLCCISHRPRTALGNRQIDALRTVAKLVSAELQKNAASWQ
jgi:GAF domain-containing protein